jgi:hypothetical protein
MLAFVHLDFDMQRAIADLRMVNPATAVLPVSTVPAIVGAITSGKGEGVLHKNCGTTPRTTAPTSDIHR